MRDGSGLPLAANARVGDGVLLYALTPGALCAEVEARSRQSDVSPTEVTR